MGTIQSILRDRAELGLADLLLAVYDHAYCAGAGLVPGDGGWGVGDRQSERGVSGSPSPIPHAPSPGLSDLLTTLEARHRVECLQKRGWLDPPTLADELPGWMLTLRQQADTIEPPPVDGWPI